MSRLTRDGTAEPISRDQILRHARGQGNIIFPVQLTTSRIGHLTRLIRTLLYVITMHIYIHAYICASKYEMSVVITSRHTRKISVSLYTALHCSEEHDYNSLAQ